MANWIQKRQQQQYDKYTQQNPGADVKKTSLNDWTKNAKDVASGGYQLKPGTGLLVKKPSRNLANQNASQTASGQAPSGSQSPAIDPTQPTVDPVQVPTTGTQPATQPAAGAQPATGTQPAAGQAATPPATSPTQTQQATTWQQGISQADTTLGEVQPNMTVQGQMAEITGKDSPLMQRARAEGMLVAGRRGLQNSSIAAGASMGSMVDRAMPMAQQDAGTYYDQQGKNQNALNAMEQFNVGNLAQSELSNQGYMQGMEMQALKDAGLADLAAIEANYKNLLQTSESAKSLLTQYQASVSTTVNNKELGSKQIQAALQTIKSSLEGGLEVMSGISSIDLSGYSA